MYANAITKPVTLQANQKRKGGNNNKVQRKTATSVTEIF